MNECDVCNDKICGKCNGHMSYGIDCLHATMNPDVDYCECEEPSVTNAPSEKGGEL